ncbi:uncharacterized protein LOC114574984 [Exaiptasia diaphana]|uniref:Uncharacterized protein n=1 Tax=Exaiptasia diaphana TaxID=2652724 RepID=A0A913YHX5_EXADI|nr:uncharacterized protein LOC114574984 [Exaiptasia diaphana]
MNYHYRWFLIFSSIFNRAQGGQLTQESSSAFFVRHHPLSAGYQDHDKFILKDRTDKDDEFACLTLCNQEDNDCNAVLFDEKKLRCYTFVKKELTIVTLETTTGKKTFSLPSRRLLRRSLYIKVQ